MDNPEFGDALGQVFGHSCHRVAVCNRQDHDELLAAFAKNLIRLASGPPKGTGHAQERFVARMIAVQVIEGAEVVDVPFDAAVSLGPTDR